MVDGGNFNYYCLNASSVLPVVLLNIKKGNSLLDMCAGTLSGLKSFSKDKRLNVKLSCFSRSRWEKFGRSANFESRTVSLQR